MNQTINSFLLEKKRENGEFTRTTMPFLKEQRSTLNKLKESEESKESKKLKPIPEDPRESEQNIEYESD
jgi:hypothetical protein